MAARRLDAAQLRHADVHEDHVGRGLVRLAHGLVAVLGLGDDLDARLGLQHHDQAPPEQGVVVADQHPDRGVGIAGAPEGGIGHGAGGYRWSTRTSAIGRRTTPDGVPSATRSAWFGPVHADRADYPASSMSPRSPSARR